jgi:hypothetical protein
VLKELFSQGSTDKNRHRVNLDENSEYHDYESEAYYGTDWYSDDA